MKFPEFFAQLRDRWKRDNKARSEDYFLGGTVALRDAEAALNHELHTQPNAAVLQRQLAAVTAERDESNRRIKVLRGQVDADAATIAALAALKNPADEGKPWETTRALEQQQQKGFKELLSDCKHNRARLETENRQLRLVAYGPKGSQFNYRKALKRLRHHATNPADALEQRLAMVLLTLENYEQVIEGLKTTDEATDSQ